MTYGLSSIDKLHLYAIDCTQSYTSTTYSDNGHFGLVFSSKASWPRSAVAADSIPCGRTLCIHPAAHRSLSCGTSHLSLYSTDSTPDCTGDAVLLISGRALRPVYPFRKPRASVRLSTPLTSS